MMGRAQPTERIPPLDEVIWDLLLGPAEGAPPDEVLRRCWAAYRAELVDSPRLPGTRAWAVWRFDLGEDEPADDLERVLRLAELDELDAEERLTIIERGNEARARIGTGSERKSDTESLDARDAELGAAVERVSPGR